MCKARKCYTTDLSDAEWRVLEPLLQKALSKQEVRGRPLELPLREVVDAVRYVLRNGVQWRDLPCDGVGRGQADIESLAYAASFSKPCTSNSVGL